MSEMMPFVAFFIVAVANRAVLAQGSSLACDFENNDFCGWIQEKYDEAEWSIGQGPTPSKETGPNSDHTYGQYGDTTGHYMYLEATNLDKRDIASLKSPPVRLIYYPNYCFSFWYHMKGEGVGVLAAVIKQEIHWVNKNETGEDWHQAKVTLSSNVTKRPGSTVIQLIAIRGMNFKSDMAIDDIQLTRGKCEEAEIARTGQSKQGTVKVVNNNMSQGQRPAVKFGVQPTSKPTILTKAPVMATKPTTRTPVKQVVRPSFSKKTPTKSKTGFYGKFKSKTSSKFAGKKRPGGFGYGKLKRG